MGERWPRRSVHPDRSGAPNQPQWPLCQAVGAAARLAFQLRPHVERAAVWTAFADLEAQAALSLRRRSVERQWDPGDQQHGASSMEAALRRP